MEKKNDCMNYIRAFVIESGKEVYVYQSHPGSSKWIGVDGYVWYSTELDFTKKCENADMSGFIADLERRNKEFEDEQEKQRERLNTMFAQLDPKAMAEHNAKIAEREYWRKLRGDIALEIIRKRGDKEHYNAPSNFVTIADDTKVLFNELYDQDQEFFNDK